MLDSTTEHECTKSRTGFSSSEFGSAISAEDETIVGIYLGLEQDIEGSMMFLMKLDSAYLSGKPSDDVTRITKEDLRKWIYLRSKR